MLTSENPLLDPLTAAQTKSKAKLPVLSNKDKKEIFFKQIDEYNRKKAAFSK